MADEAGVWVYGVAGEIAADWFAGLTGVGGQAVETVAASGLAAAVTPVSLAEFGDQALRRHLEDLDWLEGVARVHHHVVEIIAEHGPVVPMRLATVYRGPERVAAMLAAAQEDLTAALARIEARTEWGVKVYATAPDEAPQRASDESAARPGAAYLRQRRSQLDASDHAREEAAASAERIHATLGRLAAAADLRPPQDPRLSGQQERMILNGAYLVDDQRSAEFTAAVQEVAAQHEPVRIELTGPWPPYSFAQAGTLEPSHG